MAVDLGSGCSHSFRGMDDCVELMMVEPVKVVDWTSRGTVGRCLGDEELCQWVRDADMVETLLVAIGN